VTPSCLLGLAVVVAAPALKGPAKGDLPPIEGDWQLIEWVNNGASVGISEGAGTEFRPDGRRLVRDGGGPPDERFYKLHPKTTPAAIDLVRPSGNAPPDVFPCIFKIEEETLTICIGMPSGDRPTAFDAGPGSGRMIMKYKRLPKK
jgi:uncharacterized protein (TIGR03067 family)